MKNILITGCNGFIGRKLADYYLRKGETVVGVGIEPLCPSNIIYYHRNLLSDGIVDVLAEYKPDVLIHCAGNASVPVSVERPLFDFELNTKMLYCLLDNCHKANMKEMKIINLSSAGVYGNPTHLPISESDVPNPISPYALNKYLGECICVYYRNAFGLNITNVRIFSAYGPGLKKQIFWDMYHKIKQTGRLDLFGTGNESRDFIYIDDLVHAIDDIVRAGDMPLINVANGVEITTREIAEIFAESIGLDKSLIGFNHITREGDPLNWRADITKLKKCGYKQTVSIREGIMRYVKWVSTQK